jgi:signal recognition particle subunit SRP19
VDEEKAWVLWPEYFDINLTRSEGRKVKKPLAIAQPNTELISRACQSLGLEFKVEEDKAYPGQWHHKKGRVLVEKKMSKSQLLMKVGERLVRYQRS